MRKPHTASQPTVECKLCGGIYARLTNTHLRKHGYTPEQYVRTFGEDVLGRPSTLRVNTAVDPERVRAALKPEVVVERCSAATAERLLSSPEFLDQLARDVGELLFTTALRDKLVPALASVLGKRMELHAKAIANLEAARDELSHDWRVRGGPDGKPIPTPHLVKMAQQAARELDKTEDALLKTINLMLEEQRSNKQLVRAHLKPAYSGDPPLIPVPPSLPPHERETVRVLLQLLVQDRATAETPAEPDEGEATDAEVPAERVRVGPTVNEPQLDRDIAKSVGRAKSEPIAGGRIGLT